MLDAEAGISYRQAVEQALRLLSGQWVVAVLAALALGPLHFTKLLTEINSVEAELGRRTHDRPLSRKVLAGTLDRMEAAGLLLRHDETVSHPSVRYELTPTGQTLLAALRPLAKWAQTYQVEHATIDLPSTADGDEPGD
jgi:DNA-binding HxlR family transcriptional regulator